MAFRFFRRVLDSQRIIAALLSLRPTILITSAAGTESRVEHYPPPTNMEADIAPFLSKDSSLIVFFASMLVWGMVATSNPHTLNPYVSVHYIYTFLHPLYPTLYILSYPH